MNYKIFRCILSQSKIEITQWKILWFNSEVFGRNYHGTHFQRCFQITSAWLMFWLVRYKCWRWNHGASRRIKKLIHVRYKSSLLPCTYSAPLQIQLCCLEYPICNFNDRLESTSWIFTIAVMSETAVEVLSYQHYIQCSIVQLQYLQDQSNLYY